MDSEAMGERVENLASTVIDCAFHIHKELGPGLLESVYEVVLEKSLLKRGVKVERQKTVQFEFDGILFNEGLKIDLMVEDVLVLELKSVELVAPVHYKQLLTYLRLMKLSLGLLINFGAPTCKEGIRRVVNHHVFASSRLRVNQ